MICSDSVAKTFFKSQSVIRNKILSAEFNLGSASSRECLDAPAILATFTAGRTGLVIV